MANQIYFKLKTQPPKAFQVGLGAYQVINGFISKDAAIHFFAKNNEDMALDCQVEYFAISDNKQEFHARIKWLPSHAGTQIDLAARLTSGTNSKQVDITSQLLKSTSHQPSTPPKTDINEPLIAICMATYNPDKTAFTRQINSIINQSHQNWLLLVVDDGSEQLIFEQMAEICGQDSRRIQLTFHSRNVGFYHNFERALHYVPKEAQYIALADQDDFWYAHKLTTLLQTLQAEDASLAYSDMQIVNEQGDVQSVTYWNGRNNEYQDMTTVFLANTVTGAAALFNRDLLQTLLPFPARIGDAYHDHWLALVAMHCGKLAYVDKPLYDYYQYSGNVIGHCDFQRFSMMDRISSIFKTLLRLLNPKQAKIWLGQKIGSGIAIYKGECLRLSLFSDTLKLRNNTAHGFLHPLNISNGGLGSFFKYMLVHLKILASNKTTDDAEFRLAMAYLAVKIQRIRNKL